MKYEDLVKAHNEPELRSDEAYKKYILPIKDVWKEQDKVIEFLRRWQTRMPVGKNKELIQKTVLGLKHEFQRMEEPSERARP